MTALFCVRDRKANVFKPPFPEKNKVEAVRAFQIVCNKEGDHNQFRLYPDDFELLYLGEFNESTGKFALVEFPEVMASPRDFLADSAMSGPRAVSQ